MENRPTLPKKSGLSEKKAPLQFQPLSEGLGFHPFSDGLPYAPIGKTSRTQTQQRPTPTPGPRTNPSMGLGATAAGPAQYVTRPQPHRISVPVATPAPIPQSVPSPELAPSYGFGYLIKRLFAYTIDTSFNLGLCAGTLSVALWKQDLSPELLLNPGIVLVAALFLAVFNWAITTAQEVAFGTSLGKRLFGLVLDGTTSAIFLRAFFFLPSTFFGGLGLVWALFDKRKRCWHDIVVDLQPMEIAQL